MGRNLKKWAIRISVVLFVALFVMFSMASLMIGLGVRGFSSAAERQFPGDRAGALISMVGCESCSLRDRNHAVWALGQLAEARALDVLEKYYTGKPCDHEHFICQYELEKALALVRSGRNPSSFLWRWMLFEQS
jgi:hypothetical protein